MADTEHLTSNLVDLPADAPIQFFDLKAQQASLRPALEQRWSDILDHGRYINGPEVGELEAKLCDLTGAADAVAVGSGTQALVMPMLALGFGYGDAVFIPGFTYMPQLMPFCSPGRRRFLSISIQTHSICARQISNAG